MGMTTACAFLRPMAPIQQRKLIAFRLVAFSVFATSAFPTVSGGQTVGDSVRVTILDDNTFVGEFRRAPDGGGIEVDINGVSRQFLTADIRKLEAREVSSHALLAGTIAGVGGGALGGYVGGGLASGSPSADATSVLKATLIGAVVVAVPMFAVGSTLGSLIRKVNWVELPLGNGSNSAQPTLYVSPNAQGLSLGLTFTH